MTGVSTIRDDRVVAAAGAAAAGDSPAAKASTRSRILAILSLLLVAAVISLNTAYHEAWRDEADSWLAARDLSLTQLFHFTRYVGTPALSILIYMPAAKLHLPYKAMGWTNAAIAVASAWVVLRYATFPWIVRLHLLLSYFLAYEYAAIARGYSLTALALFSTAALFTRRASRPLTFAIVVLLLFNTTVHGVIFATAITALLTWEYLRPAPERPIIRRRWLALTIMYLGLALAIAQLLPAADAQRVRLFNPEFPDATYEVLTRFLITPPTDHRTVFDPLWLIANLIVFALCLTELSRRPPILVMWLAGVAMLFYVFTFKWCIPEHHAGLLLMWLIFALWIAPSYPAPRARFRDSF